MEYMFRIFRFDPQTDESPYFQNFPFETDLNKSILEALMTIPMNRMDHCLLGTAAARPSVDHAPW